VGRYISIDEERKGEGGREGKGWCSRRLGYRDRDTVKQRIGGSEGRV
jgi:hypothetical protein